MPDPAITFAEATKALQHLYQATSRTKRQGALQEVFVIQTVLGKAAGLLDMLRRYFLDQSGEGSPFVHKIDEILPRT